MSYMYNNWNKPKCTPCNIFKNCECVCTIKCPTGPTGSTGSPLPTPICNIYVANTGSDTISVIDGNTNTVTSTIPVGDGPTIIATNPNTGLIYVTNRNDDTVSVIDGTTNTVISTVPVGNNPIGAEVFCS